MEPVVGFLDSNARSAEGPAIQADGPLIYTPEIGCGFFDVAGSAKPLEVVLVIGSTIDKGDDVIEFLGESYASLGFAHDTQRVFA